MKNYTKKIQVLDDGFVQYVDHMGDDAAIPQAARVSYAKGTKTKRDDEKLIDFLMKNKHYSPFAMCQVKLHFRFPLYVNVQKLRHDRLHWNLMSARYSVMPEAKWLPEPEDIRGQGTGNKQVGNGTLERDKCVTASLLIEETNRNIEDAYQRLLELGVCREQARTVLPVGQYTEGFCTANLGDWMLLLQQRLSPHAQYEIQVYAEGIHQILSDLFPVSMAAFDRYQLNTQTLTKEQWLWIQGALEEEVEYLNASPDDRKKALASITNHADRIDLWKRLKQ